MKTKPVAYEKSTGEGNTGWESVGPAEQSVQATPGPWVIHKRKTVSPEIWDQDGRFQIATLFAPLKDVEANARLIAAAPAMLEALKALHACHRAFSSNDNWTSLDDEARAAAEAAINLAEEQQ